MLAQSFKTPAELELTDLEHKALVHVLGMLERGELKDTPADFVAHQGPPRFTGHFAMRHYVGVGPCGTAACIAGTCDLLFGTDFVAQIYRDGINGNLHDLFHAQGSDKGLSQLYSRDAARALRNYLTTGTADWVVVAA